MAENMIKFLRGNVANLPQTATPGALYFTKDEGVYLGLDNGSYHRYGDFITVADISSLPVTGAHSTCMYYCIEENVLCRYDSVKGWVQINRQKTESELKEFLGLGAMAYKSEVAEGDLNADLKAKVNAAAEGNHSHDNKTVLDGITAEKVAAWDSAEADAIAHADGLNTAMNTRVEALEAIDHEHSFVESELNKIVDGDVAKWNAAAAKAHEHANAAELAKIVEGDKAKWDAVAADHLTSADKTTLENAIKEAKKAGTDANTALETYKVANDARVLAVEEDVAEIVDGTNGVLAQAKAYSDGKLATARTEISAEIDADVKVVADDLAGYKTANDAALAGVKATAEAAATKVYTDAELAKKVDKVEGKDLIATSEIERLATLHNYDDTQVKADIAKKADAETMTAELAKKVDKVEGKSLIDDTEIARLATLHNYDDTALAGRVSTAEGKITALETESAKHALKTELEAVDAKFANYKTAEAQKAIDDEQDRRLGVIEGDYLKTADKYDDTALVARVKAIEDDYLVAEDKTELAGLITAEQERAEGIEGGLRSDVDAIKADYLKAADKTELANAIAGEKTRAEGIEAGLQEQITANANAITLLTDGVDAEKVDGVKDLIDYVDKHGTEVTGMKEDIAKNASDIAAEAKRAGEAEVALGGRLDVLEAIDHEAYVAADTALKGELTAEIAKKADATALASAVETLEAAVEAAKTDASNKDTVVLAEAQAYADQAEADAIAAAKTETEAQVKALADGAVATNAADISALLEQLTWGSF